MSFLRQWPEALQSVGMEEAPVMVLCALATRFCVGCLLLVEIQSLWLQQFLPMVCLIRGLATETLNSTSGFALG